MRTLNAHFFMAYGASLMYNSRVFPTLPSKIDSELERLKISVINLSAKLGSGLHPKVVQSVAAFMLEVNSYYTNAMEGNPSLLSDIQDALNNKLSTDPRLRNYQLEHLAHISMQEEILRRLESEENLDVCSIDFLCWIHKGFYSKLPEEMHYAFTHSGEKVPVIPGKLRDRPSSVGHHLPPKTLDKVQSNLKDFDNAYSLAKIEESKKIFAFASSHHRLLWIHPFRDGNGRVARLFTGAYQYKLGISSHGLWTVTRAFARNRSEYDKYLSLADQPRRHDFDGRGPLSEENLVLFCKYFLGECIDQLKFMDSILELHHFDKRFKQFLFMIRSNNIISKKSALVLQDLFYKGEIGRGDVQKICGVKRRRATKIIKELLDNQLVCSDSPHGRLKLYFTYESARYLFPKLV